MEYHQYADDTQLFIAVRAATIQSDLSVIEVCSTFVQQWFAINELLLNPDKSEVIFFGTNAQLKSIAAIDVVVGSSLPVATESLSHSASFSTVDFLSTLMSRPCAEPATTIYGLYVTSGSCSPTTSPERSLAVSSRLASITATLFYMVRRAET
jgi:hypothetical protein